MNVFKRLYLLFDRFFKELTPFVDLFARIWVAHLLVERAWQQIRYWDSNIFVFQSITILTIVTGLELILPIFLTLGLGGRLPAFMTFLILVFSVLLSPFIWTQDGYLTLQTFILWGIIFVLLMTHGPQAFSLDRWIESWIKKHKPYLLEKPKGIVALFLKFECCLSALSPFADLFARLWMARIFFYVGLSRLQTWYTTLYIFWYVYQMPPPFTNGPNIVAVLMALLFTLGVLLLILGIGGRLIPFFMFKVNILTSVMIPFLRTHDGVPALNQHVLWGLVLLMIMTYGTGKYSLDVVLARTSRNRQNKLSKKNNNNKKRVKEKG